MARNSSSPQGPGPQEPGPQEPRGAHKSPAHKGSALCLPHPTTSTAHKILSGHAKRSAKKKKISNAAIRKRVQATNQVIKRLERIYPNLSQQQDKKRKLSSACVGAEPIDIIKAANLKIKTGRAPQHVLGRPASDAERKAASRKRTRKSGAPTGRPRKYFSGKPATDAERKGVARKA